MLRRVRLEKPEEYFLELGQRREKGVFFYRVNGYNEEIRAFLPRYYEAARLSGVIQEGKIPNPNDQNLGYFREILGTDFQMQLPFLEERLRKWLPRLGVSQRKNVASAIYETLRGLRAAGKNDNMLKNAYIKFFCWLYYKFERIVHHLGEQKIPKLLYEGEVSHYELLFLNVLCVAGCDIVLLQYRGDEGYLRLDPGSAMSSVLALPGMGSFPEGFCLREMREDIQEETDRERLYGGQKSRYRNCTNAWLSGQGDLLAEVRKAAMERGSDPGLYYNCFCRLIGVEDKLAYGDSLYRLQLDLRHGGRRVVIVSGEIPAPGTEEIAGIRRGNGGRHQNVQQVVGELSVNLDAFFVSNQELQRMIRKAFVDLLLEEGKKEGQRIARLYNQAVCLLCWLKRYREGLFAGWKMPEISCFFYMGGCRNENEALFLRLLSRLPVDVLIFCPDLDKPCCLSDPLLYEVHYPQSLPVSHYPEEAGGLLAGTAAYHAERELDGLLYQDSGLYRNQQYQKANAVSLQTMYEEIPILWDQEVKYRPNFSTAGGVVNVPVFFAKISGVKDGAVQAYWASIKKLMTEDVLLYTCLPLKAFGGSAQIRSSAASFLKNGKLLRRAIKNHPAYPYAFLRESMQDHLLDKIELLISQRSIKGTFENGAEYAIVSAALDLDKSLLRMVQRFDFTRKNPKLVILIPGETVLSLEDSILVAFLHLVGFDVLFFVPTGYQCVERFFQGQMFEEHQIGEYMYDLPIPDFSSVSAALSGSSGIRRGIKEFLFGSRR